MPARVIISVPPNACSQIISEDLSSGDSSAGVGVSQTKARQSSLPLLRHGHECDYGRGDHDEHSRYGCESGFKAIPLHHH